MSKFVIIPKYKNDSKVSAEFINLDHITRIKLVKQDEIIVIFSNGSDAIFKGDRAKALIDALVGKDDNSSTPISS